RAVPRPGVSPGTPALPLPPDRRNHQASVHPLRLPAAVALRRPARARPLPGRRRAARPAPLRRDRPRPPRPERGRPLAAATGPQGKDVLRAGTPGRAQPLEHAACVAGAEVVGGVSRDAQRAGVSTAGRELTTITSSGACPTAHAQAPPRPQPETEPC